MFTQRCLAPQVVKNSSNLGVKTRSSKIFSAFFKLLDQTVDPQALPATRICSFSWTIRIQHVIHRPLGPSACENKSPYSFALREGFGGQRALTWLRGPSVRPRSAPPRSIGDRVSPNRAATSKPLSPSNRMYLLGGGCLV